MTYDNTNSGALFRNKDKVEGDNKPNYTGESDINGHKMRVAGWMNKSKNGVTYMSLKYSELQEKKETVDNPIKDGLDDEDLDSIPF